VTYFAVRDRHDYPCFSGVYAFNMSSVKHLLSGMRNPHAVRERHTTESETEAQARVEVRLH